MTSIIIEAVVLVILISLSAFFSASETALVSINPHQLRALTDNKVKNAETLQKVLAKKSKMLSVILIGNNIVNLSASSLTTILFQTAFGNKYVSIGTGVITLLILVFGEVSPKTTATYRAEKIALKFCPIIWVLMTIFTPLAFIINTIAFGVLKILGVDRTAKKTITESELRTIVNVSQEEGLIENDEKTFINNVFDFSDTTVKEIMVPRINVTFIKADADYEEVSKIFEENLFTRFPVIDDDDKVIGLINIKDFAFYPQEKASEFSVKNFLRPIEYTYEHKKVLELLRELKESHANMLVVLDEYGDTAGIVTLEDLLEELVGDIRDEYDDDEKKDIQKVAPHEYIIRGHVSLDDINDKLATSFSSEDFDSIGGLLIEKLGRLPENGDSVEVGNLMLTAEKVEKNKIEEVRLTVKQQ